MIVCCGEALIDMLPVSSEGSTFFNPVCGGAIFNTAIALGRLNVDVSMFTGLSVDLFGEQLVEVLHKSNVNTDACIRAERPTTLAFVKLTDGVASYRFYDENTAARCIEIPDLPNFPESACAFYFGGISLCSEPAANAYVVLAEQVAAKATIVLDPNIRPNFIIDESAYRERLIRLIAVADVIKVSDEDLEWLAPQYSTEQDRVSYLRDKTRDSAALIVVTRGSKGAQAYLASGNNVYVEAKKAEVVDTVGAGDTFNAGLLESLNNEGYLNKDAIKNLSDEVVEKALVRGAEVAAITVSRAGANPPWASELANY